MDNFTILKTLIAVISIVITGVLIPYIRTRTSKERIDKAIAVTTIAVQAAEQIYREVGQGRLKKEYVVAYLKESGLGLSEEEIHILIESAVKELNLWQEEIAKQK